MREQPHYLELLTKEFFTEHYIRRRMSYPKIRKMLLEKGHNIHVGTLYNYAKKLGIGRNRSEASINKDEDPLDWNKSYITEEILEYIDGFLLGDGSIPRKDTRSSSNACRLTCSLQHEEFCKYLMEKFTVFKSSSTKYDRKNMSAGFAWDGRTKFHPDIYAQHQRWYYKNEEGKWIKNPPKDVRITPRSVMLWYLGDGTCVQVNNTVAIRLSTDGFDKERVEFLVEKLKEKGIDCHRSKSNRIQIKTSAVPSFFKFIGKESPIKCYDYKFNLPDWRFDAKRMKQVATELNIDYQRLAYLVKIGKIECLRASEKGKPRFLPEHINEVKRAFNLI